MSAASGVAVGRSWRGPAVLLFALGCASVPRGASAFSVGSLSLGGAYRYWDSKAAGTPDAKASQGSGRLALKLRLASNLEWVLATSGGTSQTDAGTGNTSLSGVSGVSSSWFSHLLNERVLLQATLTTPSAQSSIRNEQLPVVETIGLPLLGFDVRRHRNGLEAGGTATIRALDRSGYRVTLGAGGVVRGGYRFLEGLERFHPASEWAATAGFDLRSSQGTDWPLRLDLTYRHFATDRVGDADVFREGSQVEPRAQLDLRSGETTWSLFALGVIKADNTVLAPAGSTIGDTKLASGNNGLFRLTVDRRAGRSLRLGIMADESVTGGSEQPGRNGSITAIGPVVRIAMSRATTLDLNGQYAFGTTESLGGGPRRDLSGVTLGARLRWVGGE